MKVLHAYNRHRGGGGSDNAWDETIRISRASGIEVFTFERHSQSIRPGLAGRWQAFASGVYAREAVSAFRQALREVRPDVVHVHELYPLISPWIIRLAANEGVPVVQTCYDFRLTCPVATHFRAGALCHRCMSGGSQWAVINNCRSNYAESAAYGLRHAVGRMFRLFEGYVSQYVVLSEFSRQWLHAKMGIAEERVTVSPCAIPLPSDGVDPARGEYVAFAGRFVPEKGVELLIQAARMTGLPVRLAGDNASHPAVRPGDPVQCVETRSREDLAAFYRGARMLVVPSIWYETFGIVAAEAMAHGVPVLASRIGALQDTVVDGVTGLLFEPGNAGDLALQMKRIWSDDGLCRRLGAAARERVRDSFNESVHIDRLKAAYSQAVERRQTAY